MKKIKYRQTTIILAAICIVLTVAVIFLLIGNGSLQEKAKTADYYRKLSQQLQQLSGIQGNLNDIHIHADFKVVMDGKQISFKNNEFNERNAFVHLHLDDPEDGDKVIHIEGKGITLEQFLTTLGMKFTSNCFIINETSFCRNGKELMLFVNNKRNYEMDSYVPKNHDRILIIYGSPTEVKQHINTVSNYSNRYS